ncbi:uncharacterized protein AB9X84_014792 [Acanthopagrus schlegelii]
MDVVEEKQTERFARLRARLQRLREHHDKCLSRHMEREKQQKQPSGGPNHDSESSSLPDRPFEQFPDSSLEIIQDSDSDTEIFPPESSHSGPAEDSDDPPLRITDSLLITKEYLELYSSDILQCVEQMTDSESKEFLKNLERRSRCEKKWDVSLLLRAIKDTLKEVPWNAMSLDQIDPDEEVLEVHSDLSQTETDSFCSSSSGPPRSKRGQRTSAGPGSAAATGSSRSTKRQRPESDSGDPETENTKRRSWSFAEVHTVEKTLMAFINSGVGAAWNWLEAGDESKGVGAGGWRLGATGVGEGWNPLEAGGKSVGCDPLEAGGEGMG